MQFNRIAAAAAFGALVVAGNASADTVSFNVDFDFNPSTEAMDHTLSLGDGALLTLGGITHSHADAPLTTSFGILGFDPKDQRGTIQVDRDFVMKVTVTDPTSGFGTTTANYLGSINTLGTAGSITGGSVDVAGFRFTLHDVDFLLNSGHQTELLTGGVEVVGAASAVPVPAAVWGGAGLLALLGGGKVWTRRRPD